MSRFLPTVLCLTALALAAPARVESAATSSPGDGEARLSAPAAGQAVDPAGDRAERRARLARTIGLAEALQLDDEDALRARDVLARFDEGVRPLRQRVQEGLRVLRAAARGDAGAAAQVDAALEGMRQARLELHARSAETFAELTRGLSAEKKARAALFLTSFGRRAAQAGLMRGGGGPGRMMDGGQARTQACDGAQAGEQRGGMGPGRGMGRESGAGMGRARMGNGPGMRGGGPSDARGGEDPSAEPGADWLGEGP